MSRDDSVLYTGASSASFSSPRQIALEAKRNEQKVKAESTRRKLSESAELALEEIQKEIDEVSNINFLEIEGMLTDEHFRAEMMARKKLVEKLTSIKMRINNKLRDNKA